MLDPYWSAARQRMLLDPSVTNLNTGSWGPLPRPVFERVTELRRRLAEEPMDFFLRFSPPLLWEARQRLARFVGGDPRRLIFTANVSVAVNMVAAGLRLAAPGEILLTDHEYGAMHWCWERAAQRQGLTIRTFALPILAESPDEIVEAAVAAMNERTRLFFFSHVLSPTGLVLPARRLCAEARRRGIVTMVDGAHALAMLHLDLDELDADFYGANCHKWLLAPTGAGFLHLNPTSVDRLQPLQVSWGWRPERGRQLDDCDEWGTTPRLRQLEFEGSRDICPWLTVPAALAFQEELGLQRIRGRIHQLADHVRRRLGALAELRQWTQDHPDLRGALTAFRLPPGIDVSKLRRSLWEDQRMEVPVVERPDGLLLRTSTHFYNSEDEIDRLAAALPAMLLSCR